MKLLNPIQVSREQIGIDDYIPYAVAMPSDPVASIESSVAFNRRFVELLDDPESVEIRHIRAYNRIVSGLSEMLDFRTVAHKAESEDASNPQEILQSPLMQVVASLYVNDVDSYYALVDDLERRRLEWMRCRVLPTPTIKSDWARKRDEVFEMMVWHFHPSNAAYSTFTIVHDFSQQPAYDTYAHADALWRYYRLLYFTMIERLENPGPYYHF